MKSFKKFVVDHKNLTVLLFNGLILFPTCVHTVTNVALPACDDINQHNTILVTMNRVHIFYDPGFRYDFVVWAAHCENVTSTGTAGPLYLAVVSENPHAHGYIHKGYIYYIILYNVLRVAKYLDIDFFAASTRETTAFKAIARRLRLRRRSVTIGKSDGKNMQSQKLTLRKS